MKAILRICKDGHPAEIYGCFDGVRELDCTDCCYQGRCQVVVEYKTSLQLNSIPGICSKCLEKYHRAYTSPRLNADAGKTNRLVPVEDKNEKQLLAKS